MTWVWPLNEHGRRTEEFLEVSSDLHTYAMTSIPSSSQNKKINVAKRKIKISLLSFESSILLIICYIILYIYIHYIQYLLYVMLTKRHYLSIFLLNNIYYSLNFPLEVVRRQSSWAVFLKVQKTLDTRTFQCKGLVAKWHTETHTYVMKQQQ